MVSSLKYTAAFPSGYTSFSKSKPNQWSQKKNISNQNFNDVAQQSWISYLQGWEIILQSWQNTWIDRTLYILAQVQYMDGTTVQAQEVAETEKRVAEEGFMDEVLI